MIIPWTKTQLNNNDTAGAGVQMSKSFSHKSPSLHETMILQARHLSEVTLNEVIWAGEQSTWGHRLWDKSILNWDEKLEKR